VSLTGVGEDIVKCTAKQNCNSVTDGFTLKLYENFDELKPFDGFAEP
jgi:hypothetical protein